MIGSAVSHVEYEAMKVVLKPGRHQVVPMPEQSGSAIER